MNSQPNAKSNSQAQQPNISTVPKKDGQGKPIPGTNDGTLVRIRLFDDRERVLFFKDNPNPNAAQVCSMIGEKLDIKKDSLALFSLWIVGGDLELQIRPRMQLSEMVAKWPRYMEKYTHSQDLSSSTEYKFVFKREAMVNLAQERAVSDDVAIKLLYGEARNNVIKAKYPVNIEEAVKLSAVQLLINYGEYNESKHGIGTNFILQALPSLMPKHLISKNKPQDWEIKIAHVWSGIASKIGKSSAVAPYTFFLEHCRASPSYGCTFFAACKNIPPSGYFELRSDHLYMGVNAEGMCIVDDDRHKLSWSGQYEGLEWECTPDSVTIEYLPQRTDPNLPPAKKLGSTLITPQAHLIDSLASRAIYLIEKNEKKIKSQVQQPPQAKQSSPRRQSAQVGRPGQGDAVIRPSSPTQPPQQRKQTRKASESATMVEHEEADTTADYLKAVNHIRQ